MNALVIVVAPLSRLHRGRSLSQVSYTSLLHPVPVHSRHSPLSIIFPIPPLSSLSLLSLFALDLGHRGLSPRSPHSLPISPSPLGSPSQSSPLSSLISLLTSSLLSLLALSLLPRRSSRSSAVPAPSGALRCASHSAPSARLIPEPLVRARLFFHLLSPVSLSPDHPLPIPSTLYITLFLLFSFSFRCSPSPCSRSLFSVSFFSLSLIALFSHFSLLVSPLLLSSTPSLPPPFALPPLSPLLSPPLTLSLRVSLPPQHPSAVSSASLPPLRLSPAPLPSSSLLSPSLSPLLSASLPPLFLLSPQSLSLSLIPSFLITLSVFSPGASAFSPNHLSCSPFLSPLSSGLSSASLFLSLSSPALSYSLLSHKSISSRLCSFLSRLSFSPRRTGTFGLEAWQSFLFLLRELCSDILSNFHSIQVTSVSVFLFDSIICFSIHF
ncbi:hypothetical protein C7M84_010995 [Penaeus vannamei]|uniref:Uncharacterized protein n=1 Tax=Penaeus vannamei TaxID=6689 RepID=A0A423T2M9_PENVA|nr:hypothetical protein C7M84_010995 [Penaeus vannamei]